MRSRRTGSRSIRALPPTLPPAISTCARRYVESENPEEVRWHGRRRASSRPRTRWAAGAFSACARDRLERPTEARTPERRCMSSWAMAKMLPMTRTARSPARTDKATNWRQTRIRAVDVASERRLGNQLKPQLRADADERRGPLGRRATDRLLPRVDGVAVPTRVGQWHPQLVSLVAIFPRKVVDQVVADPSQDVR